MATATLTAGVEQPRATASRSTWRNDPVAAMLRSIRLRECLFNILALALAALNCAFVYAIAEMSADRIWEFAPATRQMSLTTVAWLAAALIPLAALLILFRRLNPMYYARAVDRAAGLNDDAMVTYVELRLRKNLSHHDAETAELLKEQSLERIKMVDSDQVIETRPLNAAIWSLAGIVAVFILFSFFCGSTFIDSFYRCVMPWRDVAPPRQIHIAEVLPGDAAVISGETVQFNVKVHGFGLPDEALLMYIGDGQSKRVEEKLAKTQHGYTRDIPGFSRPVTYWVRCKDEEKGPFHLKIIERPLVTSVHLRIVPPPYAAFSPVREIAGGHAQAIVGSRIEIQASTDKKLSANANAWIQAGGQRIPMTVSGATLKGILPVQRDCEYQIGYVDDDGLRSRDGVQYSIKALPDQPPKAALRREGQESKLASRDDTVLLWGEASDDLGVARVSLQVKVIHEAEKDNAGSAFSLDFSPAAPNPDVAIPIALDLSRLALKDGDIVECTLIAEDVKAPTAQRGESAPVRIPVLPPAQQSQPKAAAQPTLKKSDPFDSFLARLNQKRSQPGSDDSKRSLDKPDEKSQQERKAAMDALREREEKLLRDLAKMLEEKNKDKEKLNKLADEQQQIADDLKALEKKDEPYQNPDDGKKTPAAGDSAKDSLKENNAADEAGDSTKKTGDAGAEKNKNSADSAKTDGNPGEKPSADSNSQPANEKKSNNPGESGKAESGKPEDGKTENGKPESAKSDGGKSDAGKSESGKAGGGKSSPDSGAGKSGEKSDSKSAKSDGAKGEKGEGAGDAKSSSGEKGKSGDGKDGPKNPGDGATAPGAGGSGSSSGKSSEKMPEGGKSADSSKKTTETKPLNDLAQKLRDGEAVEENLKNAKESLDHMFSSGRSFDSADREKLNDAMKKTAGPPDRSAPDNPHYAQDRAGRARTDLSSNQSNKALKNRPGELKEDELTRAIQSGQEKVAPEYRRALEEYYKAVAK